MVIHGIHVKPSSLRVQDVYIAQIANVKKKKKKTLKIPTY